MKSLEQIYQELESKRLNNLNKNKEELLKLEQIRESQRQQHLRDIRRYESSLSGSFNISDGNSYVDDYVDDYIL